MTQTTIDDAEYEAILAGDKKQPKQNNYEEIKLELFWIRKELEAYQELMEGLRRDQFDMNQLLGFLSKAVQDWVGVAEE